MIANRRVSKCRVRIAHATFRLRMKRVRSVHPTIMRIPPGGLWLQEGRLLFFYRYACNGTTDVPPRACIARNQAWQGPWHGKNTESGSGIA